MPWIGPSIFAHHEDDEYVTKRRLDVGDEVYIPVPGHKRDKATVVETIGEWKARAESEHAIYHIHYDDTPSMDCYIGDLLPRGRWHCDYGEHKGSGFQIIGPK